MNICAIIDNEAKQREHAKSLKSGYYFRTKSDGSLTYFKKSHKKLTNKKEKIAAKRLRKAKRRAKVETNPIRFYTLYALELQGNNYYVGMTSYGDPYKRYKEHVNGGPRSAGWTRLYKPLTILETRKVGMMSQSECAKLEDSMTVEYIDKYGIDNVRGGSMCFMSIRRAKDRYNQLKL